MLLKGVLIPRLLNNPFASCFLINCDFLAPHIAHFDNIFILPLLVFETSGFMFFVFFYTLDNKIALFLYTILLIAFKTQHLPILEFYLKVF